MLGCNDVSHNFVCVLLWQIHYKDINKKKKNGNISWNSDSKVVNRDIKNLKNNVMAGTAFKVISLVEPKR